MLIVRDFGSTDYIDVKKL